MTWKELLRAQIEAAYTSTDGLMSLVDDEHLDWSPPTGDNWMTMGQVLHHLSDACGSPCKGFVTGDWGLPEEFDPEHASPADMMPPAEALPAVDRVSTARARLAEDKTVALEMIERSSEEDLSRKKVAPPWDPTEDVLGRYLLLMVAHLETHKAQLFYYLKLQGKPVSTAHLWSG